MRVAAARDVDALVGLINAAFVVERFFIDRDRTDAATVRAMMTTGEFLIADEEAGGAVACVYCERRGAHGYYGMLAVAPAHKRRGIGGWLIDAIERRFRDGGLVAADIRVVNLREELPPMYRTLGYVEVGTEPFDDPRLLRPCHFILMSKPLVDPSSSR